MKGQRDGLQRLAIRKAWSLEGRLAIGGSMIPEGARPEPNP